MYDSPNIPRFYGPYSSILETVTAPDTAKSVIKHTKSTETSISLSWKKVSGANAYKVEYQKFSGSSEKAVYVKNTHATLKKLSKNTRYLIRVYPIRKTSNGKVKAIGDDASISISVVPGKVSRLECVAYPMHVNWVQMRCTPKEIADGYQWELYTAYKSKDKKLKTVYTKGWDNRFVHSSLKKHNFYKVRVRAYCKNRSNGKKYYGSWSDWKYISQHPGVGYQNTSKGIKANWDKIAGADRYAVYISTKPNSGYKKFCTTKGTSKTITKYGKSKLKSGKSYYVYVVAQKKVGKSYYSGYHNSSFWRKVIYKK